MLDILSQVLDLSLSLSLSLHVSPPDGCAAGEITCAIIIAMKNGADSRMFSKKM